MNSGPATQVESISRRVILGVAWSDGEPVLTDRHLPSPSQVVPARGRQLAYRIPNPTQRHCLGSISQSSDCPNPVQGGSKRCPPCSINDALHASSLHHAHNRDRIEINPEVRRHLAQPNELYLAGFRDGSIKIGTSSAWRTEERLTEQGAWIALIVARTEDGYRVRQLEDEVTARLGIPQSVATTRKLRGLANPVDDQTLLAKLGAAAESVLSLPIVVELEASLDDRRTWTNEAADDGPFCRRLHLYPNRLDGGAHNLAIEDMCGRAAIVRPADTDELLLADLGQLLGLEQEVGQFDTDEIALQGSLF